MQRSTTDAGDPFLAARKFVSPVGIVPLVKTGYTSCAGHPGRGNASDYSTTRQPDALMRVDEPAEQSEIDLPELEELGEWVIDDIVAHQEFDGQKYYPVRWEGWSGEYNTWEPEEHLANALQAVRRYESKGTRTHKRWDG